MLPDVHSSSITSAHTPLQPPPPLKAHHELYALHLQVPEDVAHTGVLPAVIWQPQSPVGIHSVQALLLHTPQTHTADTMQHTVTTWLFTGGRLVQFSDRTVLATRTISAGWKPCSNRIGKQGHCLAAVQQHSLLVFIRATAIPPQNSVTSGSHRRPLNVTHQWCSSKLLQPWT